MVIRRTIVLVAGAALLVSAIVLCLLAWLGIWEYMLFGRIDLRVIFWPSSIMIPLDWSTTARGIIVTLFSVVVNCFLYVGIALILRAGTSAARRSP